MPIQPAPNGEYAYGSLAADQTTNIAAGNPVKLATWSATLSTDGGTYRVTLEAGRAYLIIAGAGAAFSSSGGYLDLQLYDVTNAGYVGPIMDILPPSYNANSYAMSNITHIDATAGARTIELRIQAVANLTSIRATSTRIAVAEIGPTP